MKNKFITFTFLLGILLAHFSMVAQPIQGQVIDKIIAKVDNHIVLLSELETNYQQYIANNQQFKFSTDNIRCTVLENLLINKLLLAKADIDSVYVDEKQVEEQLNRRMQYFITQVGSEQKLEEYYNKTISELKNDLKRQVKDQMVIQKMQETVSGKVKITPGEVKKFYSKIPLDSLPYFSKEVEVAQIVIEAQVSKDQKNIARDKLNEIRKRIIAGEDFATLAKTYSDDPGSAANGGDLGFFKKGDLVPEYEAASLKLKPGEFTEPVESQFGFHLIQLIERRGMEYNTRHILLKPASSTLDIDATEKTLNHYRNLIVKDSIAFTDAAKKWSKDPSSDNGGYFTDQQTGSLQITVENLDPSVFFVIDTMQVGHITKPIPYRTAEGKEAMRIIYLKKIIPPHKANLADDYQKIHSAAMNEKKNRVLTEWFHKTKSEVFIDINQEYNTCEIMKKL